MLFVQLGTREAQGVLLWPSSFLVDLCALWDVWFHGSFRCHLLESV